MKNKLLKTITLLVCVCAMILGSTLSVQAEEMKEVITGEHDITISPQDQSAGYVYIDAEVPNGWGGAFQVNFHNRNTGNDHTCSMSYIENEYHSGLWLPAGSYLVSTELQYDDGLCHLELKDSSQSSMVVQKGENYYLSILALENAEDTPAPSITAPITPPKEQGDYKDLPTEMTQVVTDETVPSQSIPLENSDEEENSLGRIIRVVAIILVLIVATITIVYAIREHQQEQTNH